MGKNKRQVQSEKSTVSDTQVTGEQVVESTSPEITSSETESEVQTPSESIQEGNESDVDSDNSLVVGGEREEVVESFSNVYVECVNKIISKINLIKTIHDTNSQIIKQIINNNTKYESIKNAFNINPEIELLKSNESFSDDEKIKINNFCKEFLVFNNIVSLFIDNESLKSSSISNYKKSLEDLLVKTNNINTEVKEIEKNKQQEQSSQSSSKPNKVPGDSVTETEIFDNRVDSTPRESFSFDLSGLPDENLEGEATAYNPVWFYEGINDHNADTRLNGANLNKASKIIVKSIRTISNQISDKMSKQLVSSDYKDKSITYQKLSDDVKRRIASGGSGDGGDFVSSIDYSTISRGISNNINI